jgi:acyl-coenzyme A thioesterase PaaI-like protein
MLPGISRRPWLASRRESCAPLGSRREGDTLITNFNQALGLRPGNEPGTVLLDPRPEHQVAPDVVHFAVLTTLAEVSAASVVGAPVVPATVTVHLLTRARLAPLTGRGRLLRMGKRLAVAEGEVSQDGTLVAKATVQFAILG